MTTTFTGTAGRDTLVANTDSNLVTGGAGDDDVILSQGNTTLVFDRGFGSDMLSFNSAYANSTSGSPISYQIKFGPGLSASDLQVSYADNSQGYGSATLVLSFANSNDRLNIEVPSYGQIDAASPRLPINIQFDDGTVISPQDLYNRPLLGVQTGLFLDAAPNVSVLQVLARGPHVLYGGEGDETLIAGSGADQLVGGGGNNTFVFNADWGTDNGLSLVQSYAPPPYNYPMGPPRLANAGAAYNIVNAQASGQNVIRFSAGTSLSDLTFAASGADLLITRVNGPGGIKVQSYFDGIGSPDVVRVEAIEFSDGTSLSRDAVMSMIMQNNPNGVELQGGVSNEVLMGAAGNDTLVGGAGNDRYIGGAGNDVFVDYVDATRYDFAGNASGFRAVGGDDTYVFNRGSGQDVIYEYGGNDAIEFGVDIAPEDIAITTVPVNYGSNSQGGYYFSTPETVIIVKGTTDRLVMAVALSSTNGRSFYLDSKPIQTIRFANGVVWGATEIAQQIAEYVPPAGSTDLGIGSIGAYWNPKATSAPALGIGSPVGTAYDDEIYLSSTTTQARGGQGNDTFGGAGAADGVIFNYDKGDGSDSIGVDAAILSFGSSIVKADIQFISLDAATGAAVLSTGVASRDTISVRHLTAIQFADGTTLSGTSLADFANASALLKMNLTGTSGNDSLVGRDNGDTLSGLAGHDTLIGGPGADVMIGGTGDDVYQVDQAGDQVIENANEGSDTVRSYISYTLGDNVENLILGSPGLTGTGNDAANVLQGYGASSSETLWGLGGNDTLMAVGSSTLVGGTGDDVYEISAYSFNPSPGNTSYPVPPPYARFVETVLENADEGTDEIRLRADAPFDAYYFMGAYVLPDQVENLTLLNGNGALPSVTGNALANRITGNDQANTISGGADNDTLRGGVGNDVLTGDAGADAYLFAKGDGRDLVHADALDTLSFDVTIARSDVLAGKIGATGTDTLVLSIKGSTDTITLDNVSQLNALTLSFAADGSTTTLAQLLIDASQPTSVNLTGTSGKDTLTGGDGDDTLTALAGNDSLSGGKGNDKLDGGSGADTLVGGLGNDTLIGGKGNDTYLFNRGEGHDTIVDTDSTWFNADLLKVGSAKSNQLWLTKSGNNLDISIIGTTDTVTVQDWFKGSANKVEKITALGDNKSLSASKVNALVNAMASFTTSAMGQTTLPTSTPAAITKLIASSWA